MRKIVYALMATVTGLVLLFSYRTSVPPEPASALAEDPASGVAAAPKAATPSPSASPSTSASSGSTGSNSSGGGSSTVASPSPSPSASSESTGSSASGAGSSAVASPASGLIDGTYTGQAANTRYGPVQVQITVSGGSITDVQVPEYPAENGRDQQINSRALPRLIDQTISAQSAEVDMVSGATYTSTGYRTSLQSALDQAHA